MRMWKVLIAAPVLVTGLMLGGCGDSGSGGGGGGPAGGGGSDVSAITGTIPEAMQAFEDDGAVLEITIEGNDRMQYNRSRMAFKPGQMVRLTLKHVGTLPAQSMGHNVVILHQGEDPFDFAADASEQDGSLENEYVPDALRDRVVAFTPIIGGGESTTIEFQAPSTPGEYPFLCSFPGHAGMMNGIVEVSN